MIIIRNQYFVQRKFVQEEINMFLIGRGRSYVLKKGSPQNRLALIMMDGKLRVGCRLSR